MNKIWTLIDNANLRKPRKIALFLTVLILISAMIGAALWLVFGRIFFPEILSLLCFIGYPAIFLGYFGGLVYLFNHELA